MDIVVKDCSYFVDVGSQKKGLLASVSAKFPKGIVTVLMGHSGAGKTTLMDLIAGRKIDGIMTGSIEFDGSVNISKSNIAYVQVTDVHIGEFTVMENLYYAARFRLGNNISDAEVTSRCHAIATSVSLENVVDVCVGSELTKGISGGQKKRLSIAIELLALPAVLCLDEPTSGLDSATSLQVAETLHSLAQSGKTILCTVHQPSVDMLALWHNLLLMAEGRVVYNGPLSTIASYLSTLGFTPDSSAAANPVEWVLELMAVPSSAQRITSAWASPDNSSRPTPLTQRQAWQDISFSATSTNSDNHALLKTMSYVDESINTAASFSTCLSGDGERAAVSFWSQVIILVERHARYSLLSLHGLIAMLIRNIIGGLLYGMLYYRNGTILENEKNIVDKDTIFTAYCLNIQGLMFAGVIFIIIINAISVPAMFTLTRLFKREQDSRLYSPVAYWLALLLVDLVLLVGGSTIFVVLVQNMAAINGSLLTFYVIMLLGACLGYTQAKLCAWASRDGLSAFILYALIASFEIILSGFVIFPKDIPLYLRWMTSLMFTRWACSSLIFNEFDGFKENGDLTEGILNDQGELVLKYLDLSNFYKDRALIILIAYWLVMEAVVVIAVWPAKSKLQVVSGLDHPSLALLWKGGEDNESVAETSKQSFAIDRSHDTALVDSLQVDLLQVSTRKRQSLLSMRSSEVSSVWPQMVPRASLMEPYGSIRPSLVRQSIQSSSRITYTENDILKVGEHVPQSQQAELLFRNVTYTFASRGAAEPVRLLKGVSGIVRPGEMLAIMGTSGAGKTTLLNVIAGRANRGTIGGEILLNGQPFVPNAAATTSQSSSTSGPSCSYVMQDDAHVPVLTVKETLLYAAMLRFRETSQSSPVVQSAVNETMEQLGLTHIADSIVGTPASSSISCGQLRRLTIAVELVSRPSLLFLDEPTSGLDSYLASSVVEGLQLLTCSQRTILCTIHQPSTSVFERFDKLLLLSAGYPLYFGPVKKCRAHFEGLGFHAGVAVHINPAEFVIAAATEISADPQALEQLALKSYSHANERDKESLALSTTASQLTRDREAASTCWDVVMREWREVAGSGPIIYVLLKREIKAMTRRSFFVAVSIRTALTAILIGLLWSKSEDFSQQIPLFFSCFIGCVVWLIEITPGIHEDRLIFYRERAANATSNFASWVAMGVPMIFVSAIVSMLFSIPVYLLAGLRSGWEHFWIFYMFLFLLMVTHVLLQYLVASVTPSPMIHTLLFPGAVIPFEALLSGYVVINSTMQPTYSWLININCANWIMNGLFRNQLKDNEESLGVASYEDLEDLYAWTHPISACVYYTLAICVALKVLTYFTVRFVDHNSA